MAHGLPDELRSERRWVQPDGIFQHQS